MVNIVLIIGLLLAYVTGFFTAIKAVQLGLKWQLQTAEKKEPELKSPIQPIVEAVQQKQANTASNNQKEIINEWLYGESR